MNPNQPTKLDPFAIPEDYNVHEEFSHDPKTFQELLDEETLHDLEKHQMEKLKHIGG